MQTNLTTKTGMTTVDAIELVAGLVLVAAPWLFGFADVAGAAWNAWLVGGAIALVALGALVAFNPLEEWANLALGLWAIAAPWLVGFTMLAGALWAHVILGAIVAALAASRLWMAGGSPPSHA